MEWVKGIIASALILGIIWVFINVYINYSGFSAIISVACMIFCIIGILSLLYAIEEDSFIKGCLVPISLTISGVIGYYGAPPAEETILLCIFGSILALIVASAEGD
jgi:hypothetical protein